MRLLLTATAVSSHRTGAQLSVAQGVGATIRWQTRSSCCICQQHQVSGVLRLYVTVTKTVKATDRFRFSACSLSMAQLPACLLLVNSASYIACFTVQNTILAAGCCSYVSMLHQSCSACDLTCLGLFVYFWAASTELSPQTSRFQDLGSNFATACKAVLQRLGVNVLKMEMLWVLQSLV